MIKLIAVDLQRDFTDPDGKHYNARRQSPEFVRLSMIPAIRDLGLKIAQIVSDYRQPRPGDLDHSCVPGTKGYESIIPQELIGQEWIKCMNSPFFTRDNIGLADKTPGMPVANPTLFYDWLDAYVNMGDLVVLFGLTLDCCVLCAAQSIRFHGINVYIIQEATDTYLGPERNKFVVMDSCVSNWARFVKWEDILELLTYQQSQQ